MVLTSSWWPPRRDWAPQRSQDHHHCPLNKPYLPSFQPSPHVASSCYPSVLPSVLPTSTLPHLRVNALLQFTDLCRRIARIHNVDHRTAQSHSHLKKQYLWVAATTLSWSCIV